MAAMRPRCINATVDGYCGKCDLIFTAITRSILPDAPDDGDGGAGHAGYVHLPAAEDPCGSGVRSGQLRGQVRADKVHRPPDPRHHPRHDPGAEVDLHRQRSLRNQVPVLQQQRSRGPDRLRRLLLLRKADPHQDGKNIREIGANAFRGSEDLAHIDLGTDEKLIPGVVSSPGASVPSAGPRSPTPARRNASCGRWSTARRPPSKTGSTPPPSRAAPRFSIANGAALI